MCLSEATKNISQKAERAEEALTHTHSCSVVQHKYSIKHNVGLNVVWQEFVARGWGFEYVLWV